MEQYYLISYTCRVRVHESNSYSNSVVNIHPLQWIVNCKSYKNETYTLMNWSEITEEQYHHYKDVVN